MTISQTNPLVQSTRMMYTRDGKEILVATNVKNDLGASWYKEVTDNLKQHMNAGYAGAKANSVSGNDIGLVADSTSRVSPAAPGFHCISRPQGENTQDPEASFMDWTNLALPTKIDLYC